MRTPFRLSLILLVGFMAMAGDVRADESPWQAGFARAVITPSESMWMAGYAARTKPSEGKVQDLFAKAAAFEDNAGRRLVIITVDLIGIPRELRDWLVDRATTEYGLPASSLLLNASHTHCGPELRVHRAPIFGLAPERVEQARDYMTTLKQTLLTLIRDALADRGPVELAYTHGRAGFAMNRRLPTSQGIQNRPYPDGPVDHDVPVLIVQSDGNLRGLLFGYACHNTTLSFYQFCGDYAGYAQEYIEQAHPEVTAMFVTGCGADQNPQPRRTLALCQQHGRALANGVESALLAPPRPVRGPLQLGLREVQLDFAEPPTRAQLLRQRESGDKYDKRRATVLLDQLDREGEIDATYPYLVQSVAFGEDLLLLALAGEVVVDYSLRLQLELGRHRPVWVAGYSNDVFGYVPSLRVLQEGGYEGGGAMRYTTLPGPFAPTVEKRIVEAVHALVEYQNTR